jgi:glucose/mannose-6-phosphate isomerase
MSMISLDDPAARRACDPGGMLDLVLGLPRQVREAWRIGFAAPLPPLPAPPAHVVIAGMGGSAIGGDLLAAVLDDSLSLPLAVVRNSRLPAYVGPRSVVVATSYSGETEETLAAADSARRAGATVLAITSGGRLAGIVSRDGAGLIRVPGGLAPRAALGYLMIPALAALERWGACGPYAGDVEEAAAVLEEVAAEAGPAVPTPHNAAKRLAGQLQGRIPAVYAGSPECEAAARRWKGQFNENSKTLAAWNAFPEITHNETVGWGAPPEVSAAVSVIVLLGGDETARALRRVQIACEVAFRPAAGVHEVRGRGRSRLARLLSLVLFGDLVSVYLAYLRGIDPTPVGAIDTLRRRMLEEP